MSGLDKHKFFLLSVTAFPHPLVQNIAKEFFCLIRSQRSEYCVEMAAWKDSVSEGSRLALLENGRFDFYRAY